MALFYKVKEDLSYSFLIVDLGTFTRPSSRPGVERNDMRARDPDNPKVQDRSLAPMKMYIWVAIAIAVLFAAVIAGGSALAHFGSQEAPISGSK
jgi:hypothetical protein